jgi:hypothetical protein
MSKSAVVGGYGGDLVVWFDGGEHSPWLIGCIKYDAYLWYATANDGELLLS